MNYEIRDCIDAGTEYCPCHLAETGDCILCSQLCGKTFCDCINWKGVCIYQEYIWNGSKAKKERQTYSCKIVNKELIEDSLVIFTLLASHKLVSSLLPPGSYIFARTPDSLTYFDSPISIMDADSEENTLKFAIEIKGIKTKKLNTLNINDEMLIRAPYWNGVLGLKNIYKAKDGTSLIICRGIGQAPMIPVLKKLYANGNETIVIIDNSPYEANFINKYLEMCNSMIVECKMLNKGELTEEFKKLVSELLRAHNVNLIHCAGADILSSRVLSFVDRKIPFSCCNNAKMCCGEGICGSCTIKNNDRKLRRLCKLQTESRYVLEGRRSI